jgi:hypothetical protein
MTPPILSGGDRVPRRSKAASVGGLLHLQPGRWHIPGSKVSEYRRNAEEDEIKARAASDPDARAGYREAARQWRFLAEQANLLGE